MSAANFSGLCCQMCDHPFALGETAYASDWKVIEPGGIRWETRYTCEGCEASA